MLMTSLVMLMASLVMLMAADRHHELETVMKQIKCFREYYIIPLINVPVKILSVCVCVHAHARMCVFIIKV